MKRRTEFLPPHLFPLPKGERMKVRGIMVLLPLLGVMLQGVGYAQEVLTLDQAVEMALKQNREVLAQEERVGKVEGLKTESRSSFFPQLTLNAGYERVGNVPSAQIPVGAAGTQTIQLGNADNIDTSLDLEQVLFSWGRLASTYRAREFERQAEVAELHRVQSEVVYQVSEIFYQTLQAKELWQVKQKGYERAQDHERISESRYQQGLISRFEWLRTQSHTRSFRPQVIEAEHAYKRALLRFQERVGLPLEETVELSGDLKQRHELPSFEAVLQQSLVERPEFHRLEAQSQVLRQSVHATKAKNRPSLLGRAHWGYQYPAPDFEQKFEDNWSVGAAIEFPLFDGFGVSGKVDSLRSEMAEIDLRELQLKDRVWLEIRESLDRIEEGLALVEAREEEVQVAEEALKIAEASFKEGIVSNADVLDSQLTLDEAEVAALAAGSQYQIATAAFYKAIGGGIP
ncbi:MAG: TolC family protein [Deltaproteobacteria bacterium]|nr:TolC family protein [Deltaproteobacteria bacterium]